ncbi:MAG: tetratricopeptide repeat protein [Fuerstiella sp.]
MQFELRTHTIDVSPEWTEVRDFFVAGKSRKAWKLASSMRNRVPLRTGNDFLLNMEVARACSAHRTYMALGQIAVRRFPDDVWIQFYYARILLTRGQFLDGLKYLKVRKATLGKTHPAQWAAAIANTYASAGFGKSCQKWLQTSQQAPDADVPLCLYTRASALEDLKEWDSALELIRQCVQAAPNWTRARSYLIHCLLSRGHHQEATSHLKAAFDLGHEDVSIEVTASLLPMSLGQFSLARDRLKVTLKRWPQTDMQEYLRRTLCILLVELGDYSSAREVVAGDEERFGFPEIPDQPKGRHCFIPLPLMSQNHNQCVPTTVAMAVSVDGRRYDPDVMFREMRGREGTALWRAREWCSKNGLTVIPVRLEKGAIRDMLDAKVPLIGTLEGPFNSHVDVVCGYNDDLDTFYVRDPGHWAPFAMPWNSMESRYQLHNGLLAMISNDRQDLIAKAEQLRSTDCTALLDLGEAVARGRVKSAELAYSEIADDSPAAILREGYGVNVVISPLKFRERMKEISQDKNAHPMAQFRSILSLGPADAEESLALLLDEKQRLRSMISRYLMLNQAMSEGDWSAASALLERLLVRGGGVASFWETKSDILAELGDHVGSKKALNAAIELEPLRISTREKALKRSAGRLKLQQYLGEFETLLAEDPDNKYLLISRSEILVDGPDGKAYEAAALEALKWFPRSPDVYMQLMNWYDSQKRNDLLENILQRGRDALPDVFSKPEKEAAVSGSGDQDSGDHSSTSSATAVAEVEGLSDDFQLPEDDVDLLEIVWQPSHEARERALQEAIRREAAGELPWHVVARLVAVRLLVPDKKGDELPPPADVLPKNPPGAAHWFVNAVYDSVSVVEPSIALAKDLEAWIRELVPQIAEFPDVWFNQVLLLESAKQTQAALEELENLVERYPAKSSALYRLGVVADGQGDYAAARRYFEQALEVNPGLYGAMHGLREVCYKVNERKLAHDCTLRLRRKFPHAVRYMQDEILDVAELQSKKHADERMREVAKRLPKNDSILLKAELLLNTNRQQQAADQLEQFLYEETVSDDAYEKWLRLSLMVAQQNGDAIRTVELCDEGLKRWPDSAALLETKAGILAQTDPDAAVRVLKKILFTGEPVLETVSMYLQLCDGSPANEAIRVIRKADEDRRLWLAELFTEATAASERLAAHNRLLEWSVSEFPDSDLLLYRLALHYSISGEVSKGVRQARKLYKRNSEHPEAARLLGQCLTDQDPKMALPYLEEAASIDRNTSTLFDLARCHQIMGETKKAIHLHREILKTNPLASSSWTNLFILKEPVQRLEPFLKLMLEQGQGIHDEYFFVTNVKLALVSKNSLPEAWFASALRRWEILKTYPGFADERQKLKSAIIAWVAVRPQDLEAAPPEFTGILATIKRWTSRFSWPGHSWVPRGRR